ncbi:hypothetical protein [Ascidiimonas sp. W6]|uniref:hypothetical protein n=1 Tax=Ascidiimonas meishanensis TaxID=3128903 RepID=UPI0030ED5693
MQRFTLGTYNSFYMIPKGGFENLKELNLVKMNSNIIIERKVSLFENKVIITRLDQDKYRPQNSSSFFFGSEPEVPDDSNSDLNSKMDLRITDIASFPNFKISYFLKQTFEQYHGSNSKTRYKFQKIKLLVNNEEAYLIYPNGMGRIYKNI